MSYTVAACLGVIGTLVLDLFVLRTRLVLRRVFWLSYAIVLVFQLATNGVLTGLDVVTYDPAAITGLRVVNAPVEDLLFGFALVVQSMAWWVWWGRRLAPPVSAGPRGHARTPAQPPGAVGRD